MSFQLEEFVELSGRSENMDFESIIERFNPETARLLHGIMGCGKESGELLDAYNRYLIYGKELDKKNIIEEIGDVMFYVALICRTMNVSLEQVCSENIAKLSIRYPDKFSNEAALARADKGGSDAN
jgi:NTP pyrophosphatase (non-canonical NTP hydrolase)